MLAAFNAHRLASTVVKNKGIKITFGILSVASTVHWLASRSPIEVRALNDAEVKLTQVLKLSCVPVLVNAGNESVVRPGSRVKAKDAPTDFNAGNDTEVNAARVLAWKNPKALISVGNEIEATLGEV